MVWYQFEQNWTKGTQVKDKNLQMLTVPQNGGHAENSIPS